MGRGALAISEGKTFYGNFIRYFKVLCPPLWQLVEVCYFNKFNWLRAHQGGVDIMLEANNGTGMCGAVSLPRSALWGK